MSTSTFVALLLGLLIGAALGALLATLAARLRAGAAVAERDLLRERVTDLESAASQDRELVATLSPLAGALQRVEDQVRALERDRLQQYSRLGEQIEAVRSSGEALRAQTAALAGALRSPTARGTWGEVQLRRVVEHAGMLPRVDFTTQVVGTTPDGDGVRPDLVVHLPGGKHVVVDAKAPLAAFLEASEPGTWRTTGSGSDVPRRSTPARCGCTSTRSRPRSTGRPSTPHPSSSSASCPARRSSPPRVRPTLPCSSTPCPAASSSRRRPRCWRCCARSR